MKKLVAATLLLTAAFTRASAQSDTLHIYYSGTGVKVADTSEAKIGRWAKSLNGKKVDVQVLAYYSEKEFKKYSQERADEMFLAINRKAREVVNITSIGPVKGQKSQRSIVDIVYTRQGQSPQPVAAKPADAQKPSQPVAAAPTTKEEPKPEKNEPKKEKPEKTKKGGKDMTKQDAPASKPESQPVTSKAASSEVSNPNGLDELNSAPTIVVSDSEPLKVMVNGEAVEYHNGKKTKKK